MSTNEPETDPVAARETAPRPTAPPPDAAPDRPLRPFFVVWSGQAVSLLGTQAAQFALIWWLTLRTGSATVLAGATLVALLPTALSGPLIGAFIDRGNRKRIMLLADGVAALCAAILGGLFLTDSAGVPQVLALLFVRSVAEAFHAPAMIASTSLMVPARHLTRIQGLNQLLQGGALIVSAPLGALLVALLPMAGVMAVDVGTAAVAMIALAAVRVPQPPAGANRGPGLRGWWSDTLAGVGYLRRRQGHLGLLAMAALVNMCLVPAFSLLPLFVTGELRGSALELGTLHSSFGVGMIGGGVLLGVWGGFRRRIVTTLSGLIGLGVAICGLGLVPPERFPFALAAMGTIGVMSTFTNGPVQAILQATIAPEFQGRVFTIYASLSTLAAPIGLAFAAPLAERFGVRTGFVLGGTVCIAMALAALATPSIQRIEDQETASAAA